MSLAGSARPAPRSNRPSPWTLIARAWYNLGLAYHATGQTENAIQSLLRAEAADPRAPQFPYARATILARAGRVAEARAAASRALQLQPDFREAAELLEALSR